MSTLVLGLGLGMGLGLVIGLGEGKTSKLQLNYSVTHCDIRISAHPLFTRGHLYIINVVFVTFLYNI